MSAMIPAATVPLNSPLVSRPSRPARPSIDDRRHMRQDQIPPIRAAANAAGAHAALMFRADGRVDEVHVFGGGELAGSIFRPAGAGLAVWREGQLEKTVTDARAAIAACVEGCRATLRRYPIR